MKKCWAVDCDNEAHRFNNFCLKCIDDAELKLVNLPNKQRDQIENNFKYHSPKKGQLEKYTDIREKAKELAHLINDLCPDSREKSVAFTELETAIMWANASIARNE